MSSASFTKHQIVTFKPKSSEPVITGFLEVLTDKKLEITFDRDGDLRCIKTKRGWSPDAVLAKLQATAHAGTPISATLQKHIEAAKGVANAPTIRKGDVVEYEHEGQTCTARVDSGGKQPRVIHSDHMELGIPRGMLTRIDLPQPNPALADWGVSNHVNHGVRMDGYASTLTVTRGGKPVIEVIDNGDGAPCMIEPCKKGAVEDIKALEAALNDYLKAHKLRVPEPIDCWADYAWAVQPRGITLAEYLADFRED